MLGTLDTPPLKNFSSAVTYYSVKHLENQGVILKKLNYFFKNGKKQGKQRGNCYASHRFGFRGQGIVGKIRRKDHTIGGGQGKRAGKFDPCRHSG
jgi:hypothetical protein